MLSPFFIQTLAMSGVVITLLIVAALIALPLLWVMGAYNEQGNDYTAHRECLNKE